MLKNVQKITAATVAAVAINFSAFAGDGDTFEANTINKDTVTLNQTGGSPEATSTASIEQGDMTLVGGSPKATSTSGVELANENSLNGQVTGTNQLNGQVSGTNDLKSNIEFTPEIGTTSGAAANNGLENVGNADVRLEQDLSPTATGIGGKGGSVELGEFGNSDVRTEIEVAPVTTATNGDVKGEFTVNPEADADADAAAESEAEAAAAAAAEANQKQGQGQSLADNSTTSLADNSKTSTGAQTTNVGGDTTNYESRSLALQATQSGNSAVRNQFSSCNEIENKSLALNILSGFSDAFGIGGSSGGADIADERCQVIESYLARLENQDLAKFKIAYLQEQARLSDRTMVLQEVFTHGFNRKVTPGETITYRDGTVKQVGGTNQNSDATPLEHVAAWVIASAEVDVVDFGLKVATTAHSIVASDGEKPTTTGMLVVAYSSGVDYDGMKGKTQAERLAMMRSFANKAKATNDGSDDTLVDMLRDMNISREGFHDFVAANPYANETVSFGFDGSFPVLRIEGANGAEDTVFNIGNRESDEALNEKALNSALKEHKRRGISGPQ